MTEDLRQETSDAELADAIFCFPTGVLDILLSQDVERNGSTATITATYSLSNPLEGGDDARTVERVWQFERVQDGWLLSDLPSCTFDATG